MGRLGLRLVCLFGGGVGWVGEWVLNKWHSLYAGTHYKHEYSVLNSIWPKGGLGEFWENILHLVLPLVQRAIQYCMYEHNWLKCKSNRHVKHLKKLLQWRKFLEQGSSRTTCLACFCDHILCNHCNIRFENTSKYEDTLTLFSKNLNQRSLTPRWPLTPCLLRSHGWLYPRIIVSKSHDNTSTYVDTVINFAKYHIHTHTTYIHTYYILRTEWVIT